MSLQKEALSIIFRDAPQEEIEDYCKIIHGGQLYFYYLNPVFVATTKNNVIVCNDFSKLLISIAYQEGFQERIDAFTSGSRFGFNQIPPKSNIGNKHIEELTENDIKWIHYYLITDMNITICTQFNKVKLSESTFPKHKNDRELTTLDRLTNMMESLDRTHSMN